MSCGGEKNSLRATGVFASVYILSGVLITSVGIYTMKHLPELFTTGSVIWSGIIVSCLGMTMMAFVCCGSVSFQKGMVVALISVIIMVICIISIILLETIEWKYGIPPVPHQDPEKESERNFIFFITCLLSMFGTVLALVTSIFNLLYSYCVLLIPMKKMEKKRAILKEKVKLHRSVKVKSPRRIQIDGNKSLSKRPKSPERLTPSGLPQTTVDHKVHEWVYNNEISSEMSMSSQGTEMTANKAFLKEMLEAAGSPKQNDVTFAFTTCHQSTVKDKVPEITVSNDTPYQRKKIGENQSTFSGGSSQGKSSTTSEGSKETSPLSEGSKETKAFSESSAETLPFSSESSQETSTLRASLEVPAAFNRNDSVRRSFRTPRGTSEVKDVHTAFNKLDRALNGTISPGDVSDSKLDHTGYESEPGSPTSYEIISSRPASPDSAQEAKITLNTSSFEIIVMPPDSNLNTSSFEVISYKLDCLTSPQTGSTGTSKLDSTTSPIAAKLDMKDLEAVEDGYMSTVSSSGSTSGSQTVPDYSRVIVDGRPLSGKHEVPSLAKGERAVPDVNGNDRESDSRSVDVTPPAAAVPTGRSRLSSVMIEDLMGQLASTRL